MDANLQHRLDDMEDWRDAFLVALGVEPEARLAWREGGTAWSALDTVQHLVLVEEGVVGYARKKLQGPPQAAGGLGSRVRLGLLVAGLRSPLRFRAPAPQVVPSETLPLATLRARWEASGAALRTLLSGLGPERLGALFFRHPVAGPLDPHGTLRFLLEHARHHDALVRRALASPAAPKG